MHGFSGLEAFYVAILYCLRLGRLGNAWIFRFGRVLCRNSLLFEPWEAAGCYLGNSDFGGPIEEKVSCLEGCYVAILYCLKVGRLGNAWIFRFGRALCSNSLLFEAWKA